MGELYCATVSTLVLPKSLKDIFFVLFVYTQGPGWLSKNHRPEIKRQLWGMVLRSCTQGGEWREGELRSCYEEASLRKQQTGGKVPREAVAWTETLGE